MENSFVAICYDDGWRIEKWCMALEGLATEFLLQRHEDGTKGND